MDARQRNDSENDSEHELSLSGAIYVLQELSSDGHAEIPATNEPEALRNTITTATGSLISGSATIFEGENEVSNLSSTIEMGRLQPQTITRGYSDSSSSIVEDGHSVSVSSFHQNQPSFSIPHFQSAQQTSIDVPSSDQLKTQSAAPRFEENWHLDRASSSHQNQLPASVGSSNSHQASSDSTGTSRSTDICWYSIGATSYQGEPSLGNSSFYQSETPLGVPRGDQNSSVETTNTSANTPHASTSAISHQSSTGLPLQNSFNDINKKILECDECRRKFRNKSQLRRHLVEDHNMRIKLFECDKCDINFLSRKDRERHYRTHTGEKPFKCDMCSRKFNRKDDLDKHYRRVRTTGNEELKCSRCDEKFAGKCALKVHKCTDS